MALSCACRHRLGLTLSAASFGLRKSYGFMFQTGRGPLPVTSASGVVPMKPRMASSKSCRSANGSVFANSALAFNVAGSGPLGAIWPCAAGQPTAMMTAIAAALYVFNMNFSRSGEYDIEIGQRHGENALAGRCE